MNKKRAQGWGFDLIIATTIFLGAIIIFYIYIINSSQDSKQTIQSLKYDGNLIAESLLSEGYPKDWNFTNVIELGILSNNQIDPKKTYEFYQISFANYQRTKSILSLNSDFYLNFSEDIYYNNFTINIIGNYSIQTKNLIKTTRVVAFNNRPINIYIYTWN